MLLASTDANDRQGKNSHMHMKVQGRLMQVHFIEQQVFAKTNKVGYFSNRVVYTFIYSGRA